MALLSRGWLPLRKCKQLPAQSPVLERVSSLEWKCTEYFRAINDKTSAVHCLHHPTVSHASAR